MNRHTRDAREHGLSSGPVKPPGGGDSESGSFDRDARTVLQRVQRSIRDMISPTLGKFDVRAADLVEVFSLDNRLAWRIVKVLNAKSPLSAAKYLPGERGLGLLLQGAERAHASASSMRAVREAFEQLDTFVSRQAGDRRSFTMMVSGHTVDEGEDSGLEHRRGAFEHSGFIWGVQAKVQIHSYIIRPSEDGQHLDFGIVRGFIDLRRVRPRVPWRISRFCSIDETGKVRSEFEREPLDEGCAPGDIPLLRRFCSQPLPLVRRQTGSHGIVEFVLAESDVGNEQAVTCITGELIRRAEPAYPTPEYQGLGTFVTLRTPCQLAIMDVFLDRRFFGLVDPTLLFVNNLFESNLSPHTSDLDRLPCPCRIERLSDGVIPAIREFSRYEDMMDQCFSRLGQDKSFFSCYRARLAYPPVPTTLVADFPLPPRA
ncbi:MAG: hypothetical protein GIKADHBN_02184 [Phycisphaerales bacterium]|nr:hypothetical protein [Phycisphaerales bacterium]